MSPEELMQILVDEVLFTREKNKPIDVYPESFEILVGDIYTYINGLKVNPAIILGVKQWAECKEVIIDGVINYAIYNEDRLFLDHMANHVGQKIVEITKEK